MACGSRNDTVVTTSRRSRTVVDLLIAYSKRLDLVSELVSAVGGLQAKEAQQPETARSVRSGQAPRVWRVNDRLSEADLCSLISSYRAGMTAREVAEQFNISKSSVKRLYAKRAYGAPHPSRNPCPRQLDRRGHRAGHQHPARTTTARTQAAPDPRWPVNPSAASTATTADTNAPGS
jgi:hypothetical protein